MDNWAGCKTYFLIWTPSLTQQVTYWIICNKWLCCCLQKTRPLMREAGKRTQDPHMVNSVTSGEILESHCRTLGWAEEGELSEWAGAWAQSGWVTGREEGQDRGFSQRKRSLQFLLSLSLPSLLGRLCVYDQTTSAGLPPKGQAFSPLGPWQAYLVDSRVWSLWRAQPPPP